MKCVFLDLIRKKESNGNERTLKKDCKAGLTKLELHYDQVENLCETNLFMSCPRFQANVMINQGNFITFPESNTQSISELKLPCIFSDIGTLETYPNYYENHDCKIEFDNFKLNSNDFSEYCKNENFLNCPRFKARIMMQTELVFQDQLKQE